MMKAHKIMNAIANMAGHGAPAAEDTEHGPTKRPMGSQGLKGDRTGVEHVAQDHEGKTGDGEDFGVDDLELCDDCHHKISNFRRTRGEHG